MGADQAEGEGRQQERPFGGAGCASRTDQVLPYSGQGPQRGLRLGREGAGVGQGEGGVRRAHDGGEAPRRREDGGGVRRPDVQHGECR